MSGDRLKFPLAILLTGLAIGFLGDLMLYKQPIGISIPIIVLLLTAALIGLAIMEGTQIVAQNLWIVLPMLTLAAFSAIRAEPMLRFMNIGGSLLLGFLLANRLATRPLIELNVGGYLGAWLESVLSSIFMPFALLGKAFNRSASDEAHSTRVTIGRVVVGLAIAFPFLMIFTALLSSADMIFNRIVQDALKAIKLEDVLGHVVFTGIYGWLAMGGLAYGLSRSPEMTSLFGIKVSGPASSEDAGEAPSSSPNIAFSLRGMLGSLEAAIVLFSIDILFLVFVIIQATALFGGETFLRSQGLTYSEYARRGFFELLAVSMMVLGLILVVEYLTKRETTTQRLSFMIGGTLMVALTISILASAYYRMQLYELAYGFTRLRVYPHVFMIWLAILFLAFLVTLYTRQMKAFATACLAIAIGFVVTMDILNPDAFIVRQNLARVDQEVPIDYAYLGSLSEDAIPSLLPLLDNKDARDVIGPWLHFRLEQLDRRQKQAGLTAYHWSISQAYTLLDARRDQVTGFDLNSLEYSYER
jgi:hypothetical protein